jgi:hypothetical protein
MPYHSASRISRVPMPTMVSNAQCTMLTFDGQSLTGMLFRPWT